jgi:hypothetical protein
LCAQVPAQSQQQRRLAAAHGSADADGEGALVEVAAQGLFALVKMAGVIKVFVGVIMAMLVAVRMCSHKFGRT